MYVFPLGLFSICSFNLRILKSNEKVASKTPTK